MTSKDTAMNSLIKAHIAPKYLGLLKHPILMDMIQRFMDWDRVVLLKRNMLRHSLPGAGSTGIHYDKLFLRVGKDDFLTAWIPLGVDYFS
jgi:phytanoyl-CoA hydroxylase